jgi:hypothetical protein
LSSHISLNYVWLIMAILFLMSFTPGQDKPSGFLPAENFNEELYLVTDRDVYISGEEVYIKVFCRDGETHRPAFVSKVAYISLLDPESVPVTQIKVWLKGSSGSGKFLIPEVLPTGRYIISACTEWMRNSPPESYAGKLISVINPFKNIDHIIIPEIRKESDSISSVSTAERTGVAPAERFAAGQSRGAVLIIESDKTALQPREKVTVRIKATNPQGKSVESDLVVSVFKSFAYDSQVHVTPLSGSTNRDNSPDDLHNALPYGEALFLPEPEGHIIQGAIYSTVTGEPIVSENIVLSFVGKTPDCHFYKTDGKGVFVFIVHESGKQEIFVQPFDKELQDYYIELANPFPEVFADYQPGQYYIDTTRLNEINNAIISMQVQAIYNKTRETSGNYIQQESRRPFYGDPDHEIVLADYIEFSSLEEVFWELLQWAPVRTMAGEKRMILANEVPDQYYLNDPFLLVDGIPVTDHKAVLSIPIKQVEKIKIVNSRYFVKDMFLEGIIDISTVKGDLKATSMAIPGLRMEFEAPLAGSDFYSPEYLTDDQKNSRIPDCRNTLYWNPDIRTGKNGDVVAEFYTSDEPGDYLIIVEGITDEGLFDRASLHISVEAR